MSAPLSKALPPPPSAAVLAHRRRQKRLVLRTLLGLIVVLVGWQIYDYMASAPERAQEKLQLGVSLLHPGTYERAIEEFSAALELNPNLWSAYLQRGVARQNLGALDQALVDFEKALALSPTCWRRGWRGPGFTGTRETGSTPSRN